MKALAALVPVSRRLTFGSGRRGMERTVWMPLDVSRPEAASPSGPKTTSRPGWSKC